MQSINQLLEHPALLAYFVGASNYTWLHFRNGDRQLLSKPISYFEEQLPAFIRVHKTALINPASIMNLKAPTHAKMPGMVRMQDGIELPVSRRRWDDVIRRLETSLNDVQTVTPLPDEVVRLDSMGGSAPTDYSSPPLLVMAVMTGDALLLTRECIDSLGITYVLQQAEIGASLANSLLLSPVQEWPALIILDARTNRADRFITLRTLKSHDRLRSIPVIWLAAPSDDVMQPYKLDANSVVVISSESTSFVRAVEQLCHYWLLMAQLPKNQIATGV